MAELQFSGDVALGVTLIQEVTKSVRAGDGPTKENVDHALAALGHFHAAFRPADTPKPIGEDDKDHDCEGDDCPRPDCPDGVCDELEMRLPQVSDGKVAAQGLDLKTMLEIVSLVRQLINLFCDDCNL